MDEITAPALLIDEDKCRRNIRHMATKATHSGVAFRPHFKTHQSVQVGRWFREAGVDRIAVSSLTMAKQFADDQWSDIMVAFAVNAREMNLINQLAANIKLSILIADGDVLPLLQDGLKHPVGFYLKLDVGNHRSGIYHDDLQRIQHVLDQAASFQNLVFRGFVAHAGHTYQTQSLNEVQRIFKKGGQYLATTTGYFLQYYPDIISSWGDTPTCSLANDFFGINEIRPGNFVFYDLTQYHLASCDWEQIGVAVAAPVVSRQKERGEIVLYAGAVHLSKDTLDIPDTGPVYGEVVKLTPDGWERFVEPLYVHRISQEHSIFRCPDIHWDEFAPGTLAGIIPVHSCLSADLLKGQFYNLKHHHFM